MSRRPPARGTARARGRLRLRDRVPRVAAVTGEGGAEDAQPAAAREDRAAATAVEALAGGVPALERDVLDGQPRRGLVLAVRGGELLGGGRRCSCRGSAACR